jgi:hypothetical protein
VFAAALAITFVGTTEASAAPTSSNSNSAHGCPGGTLTAGTYSSLIITGTCHAPATGTVTVLGSIIVAPGGAFDGVTFATVRVGGSVIVGPNAILGLGCSPEVGCPGDSSDYVKGSIVENGALVVLLHNSVVGGSVVFNGGGGGVNCDINARLSALAGTDTPAYMDVETSTIGGSFIGTGMRSCWFGIFRTSTRGSMIVSGNQFADPDATEVADNTVGGSLLCFHNSPVAQAGDSGGGSNTAQGGKFGECAKL